MDQATSDQVTLPLNYYSYVHISFFQDSEKMKKPNNQKNKTKKFLFPILRIGGAGKWHFVLFFFVLFCLLFCFLFCFWLLALIWGSIYFCTYYEWFLQNLEKGFIGTNMQTNVQKVISFIGSRPSLLTVFFSPLLYPSITLCNFMGSGERKNLFALPWQGRV